MGPDVGLALLDVGVDAQGTRRRRHAAAAKRPAALFYRGRHARRSVGPGRDGLDRLLRYGQDTWRELKNGLVMMLRRGRWHAIWFTAFSTAGCIEVATALVWAWTGNSNALPLTAIGTAMWCLGATVFAVFLTSHQLPPDGGNR